MGLHTFIGHYLQILINKDVYTRVFEHRGTSPFYSFKQS